MSPIGILACPHPTTAPLEQCDDILLLHPMPIVDPPDGMYMFTFRSQHKQYWECHDKTTYRTVGSPPIGEMRIAVSHVHVCYVLEEEWAWLAALVLLSY